ncbi:BspA family leucine-rich repeat surface protein [Companilactobacillus sp. HBUAS59699]|uniref:BspA family leucine-rich repeat surface protein n=1 Tax=Companilactobacillus sp. HBUAS59699 TaxID=3109358 RepID=UPI002FF3639F
MTGVYINKIKQCAVSIIVVLVGVFLTLSVSQTVKADDTDIQQVLNQDNKTSTTTIMPLIIAITKNSSADDIASGTFGNCTWSIDANGRLDIEAPAGGTGLTGEVGNTSNGQITGLPWIDYRKDITSVYVGTGVIANQSSYKLFANLDNVTDIDVGNLNTRYLKSINSFFTTDPKLTNIVGLENWSTSQMTDMSNLFSSDSAITSINGLQNWDVSNVVNMRSMFSSDKKLVVTGLDKWNTSNVQYMDSMFNYIANTDLTQIQNWDVSNVTDMSSMFVSSSALTNLDISNWKTSNLTNTSSMFKGCSGLKSITGIGSLDVSKVTTMAGMFSQAKGITELSGIENWDTSNVKNMNGLFSGTTSLESLDLSKWNTTNVTDMGSMFSNDSNLNEDSLIGISNFDTSNVTNMESMFNGTGFVNLNLDNFKTEKVQNMNSMFAGTNHLKKISGSFDTGLVTNMSSIFNGSSISDFSDFNIADWNTSKVTNFSSAFQKTQFTDYGFLTNWDVSSGTNFNYMFTYCSNMTVAPTEKWILSNKSGKIYAYQMFCNDPELLTVDMSNSGTVVVFYYMIGMFSGDSKLATVNLSGVDNSSMSGSLMADMFKGTTSLWKLQLGSDFVILPEAHLEDHAAGSVINDPADPSGDYKAVSSYWQAIGNGTDHDPDGDFYSKDQLLDLYSGNGATANTYVWQQKMKMDISMDVPDVNFGTISNLNGLTERSNDDWGITVNSKTFPDVPVNAKISVSAESPLTSADGTHTLDNALIFKDNTGSSNVVNSTPVQVYDNYLDSGYNFIKWDSKHGLLLDVNDTQAPSGKYTTTLDCTMVNSV